MTIIISLFCFSIQDLPGDPTRELAAMSMSADERANLKQSLGLNDPLLVQYWRFVKRAVQIANAIITEAALSFLGLGVQPPAPSWGTLIREGTRYMLVAPHLVLAPACALLLVVLSVNLLGDRLRDYLDVRSRCG